MRNIRPLPLNDANFRQKLRAVIQNTSNIQLTLHARDRMKTRRVSFRQVLECLRQGRVCEPAHLTVQGDWKATLKHQYAGDVVRVAVALRKTADDEFAVVITVIDE
jgi:Domain of unknown function (DUF4258)